MGAFWKLFRSKSVQLINYSSYTPLHHEIRCKHPNVRVPDQVRDKNGVQRRHMRWPWVWWVHHETTNRGTGPEILTSIVLKMEDEGADMQSKIDRQLS